MIKHLALGSLVLLGSTLLAGCGVSGHLSATPTGNGNYNVSGTVHTSGVPTSSSPSSNPPPSSNTSSNPPSSSAIVQPSTNVSISPSEPESSPVSTTIALPRDASQWPPVVRTALTWISHHDASIGNISLPLEGPRWIPVGTVSPIATSNVGLQYSVGLWNTPTALPVNSASLNQDKIGTGPIASWTIGVGSAKPQPLTLLEGTNGLWSTPRGSGASVNLGYGIIGTYYAQGRQGQHLIVWHEGSWIWEVGEGSSSANQAIAEHLVAYFHLALLPPGPGVGVVNNLSPQKPVTMMDWSQKGITIRLQDALSSPTNPLDTAHMAVSWKG